MGEKEAAAPRLNFQLRTRSRQVQTCPGGAPALRSSRDLAVRSWLASGIISPPPLADWTGPSECRRRCSALPAEGSWFNRRKVSFNPNRFPLKPVIVVEPRGVSMTVRLLQPPLFFRLIPLILVVVHLPRAWETWSNVAGMFSHLWLTPLPSQTQAGYRNSCVITHRVQRTGRQLTHQIGCTALVFSAMSLVISMHNSSLVIRWVVHNPWHSFQLSSKPEWSRNSGQPPHPAQWLSKFVESVGYLEVDRCNSRWTVSSWR